MTPPLVSVLIVNFNGIRFLPDCISSVLSSSYPNLEVIVVDNGSTDGSLELLREKAREDGRMKVVALGRNLGLTIASNIGVRRSRGEHIAFLNSDTVVDTEWLTELVSTLENDKTVGAAQAKLKWMSNPSKIDAVGITIRGGWSWVIGSGKLDRGQFDDAQEIFAAHGAAMMARKEAFTRVGGFDTTFFMYFMDVDLCWRMRLLGYKITLQPKAVVLHAGAGSVTEKLSAFLCFDITRNHLISFTRNLGCTRLILTLPLSILLTAGAAVRDLVAASREQASARIGALGWILLNVQLLRRKRRHTQRTRRVSDPELFGWKA
jgi:hypothetical protein